MPKIPIKLRLGEKLDENSEKIIGLLDDAYLDIAPNLNAKPDMIIQDRDPNTPAPLVDDKSDLLTIWLNSSSGDKFILTALPSTWTAF